MPEKKSKDFIKILEKDVLDLRKSHSQKFLFEKQDFPNKYIDDYSPSKTKNTTKKQKATLEFSQEIKDPNNDSIDYRKFHDFILTSNHNITILNDLKDKVDMSLSPQKNILFESTSTTTYKKKILGNSLNKKFNKALKQSPFKVSSESYHVNLRECPKEKDNVSLEKKLSFSVNVKGVNQLHSRVFSNVKSTVLNENYSHINVKYNNSNTTNNKHSSIKDCQTMFNSKLFSDEYKKICK